MIELWRKTLIENEYRPETIMYNWKRKKTIAPCELCRKPEFIIPERLDLIHCIKWAFEIFSKMNIDDCEISQIFRYIFCCTFFKHYSILSPLWTEPVMLKSPVNTSLTGGATAAVFAVGVYIQQTRRFGFPRMLLFWS